MSVDAENSGVLEGRAGREALCTLVLHRLRCDAADDFSSDEPYITVNEEEVWRAVGVDPGDIRAVGVRRRFGDVARLMLYQGEFAADDLIGSRIVDSGEAGLGVRSACFSSATAQYVLEFEVE
ncbi:hypothetical protein ACQI4L_24700 [Mycolicibacterium litorale]|uniref:hypothetical protein n=1 Tax=Mycolicibacterium litorale TaxID=758802 RepID=UPI003CF74BAE